MWGMVEGRWNCQSCTVHLRNLNWKLSSRLYLPAPKSGFGVINKWWLGELCGASVWGVWNLSCCKQLLGVLLVSIRISIVELQHCET